MGGRGRGRRPVHIRHFSGLGLAKLTCESPSFARTFAKRWRDIKLRHSQPEENLIACFGGRSAAIRLMLLFCSSQPHRPNPERRVGRWGWLAIGESSIHSMAGDPQKSGSSFQVLAWPPPFHGGRIVRGLRAQGNQAASLPAQRRIPQSSSRPIVRTLKRRSRGCGSRRCTWLFQHYARPPSFLDA
jgi:hypothetical protein